MIPFNKPYFTGKEVGYLQQAVDLGKISGDGFFTKKCHNFFESQGFNKSLLTTSCTDALEMAAILTDIQPGDEVIIPSYTFVSTANAFVLRGAKVIFTDSKEWHPNIDEDKIEDLITDKTKAIVPVHYAGMSCNMGAIMDLASKYDLFVIEDAAQAIDSYYENQRLGSIGNFGAFSFHETKNIISGEGGMLSVNDDNFRQRAEIIWEKGTNRSAFFRGEVDKYGWVDVGSSFLPSDIIAAILYAQLEHLENIQLKRKQIWNRYHEALTELDEQGRIKTPIVPEYATNNAHMYYFSCADINERDLLLKYLKKHNILAVFHYLSLHKSTFFHEKHSGAPLPNADRFSDTLVRLPLFYELKRGQQDYIIDCIREFYK